MSWRLGVDTGGTFTDIVLLDEDTGAGGVEKVPSDREDPSTAIMGGIANVLERFDVRPEDVRYFGHGTTIATNAVLEQRTATVGMLTTEGFRDVLELARQRRPHLYDLDVPKPDPVIPRHLRLEVRERVDASGEIVRALDEAHAAELAGELVARGVDAVAVCLLHSYLNPTHERRLRELVARSAPGMPVSLSNEVHSEFREFGRFSTTVLNAALVPVMSRYLSRLEQATREFGLSSTVHVIQSSGGVMSSRAAGDRPVATLFSGPSAGVLGAVRLAGAGGVEDLLTLDMGGTSTDVCLVRGGEVPRIHERELAGKPVLGASVDVHSAGSGGGSIAWIDEGGLLKVGPRSAGARPGPACYGKGGTEPTVTDANAVLGYLHPDAPLGGKLRIDVDAARTAVRMHLADPAGLSVEEAAAGVLRVLQANLVRAVRVISVERGSDPRDFTLMPFGGAGGLHAARLARDLGMRRILVPPAPGVLAAYGALAADLRADFSATCLVDASPSELEVLRQVREQLTERVGAWLAREGVRDGEADHAWALEMRYARQNYQLSVEVPAELNEDVLADAVRRFHLTHEDRYGYASPGEAVRIATVRLAAVARAPHPSPPCTDGVARGRSVRRVGQRQVYEEDTGGFAACDIYDRTDFEAGTRIEGPAIVVQTDSTTVLLRGQHLTVDGVGNLCIEEST